MEVALLNQHREELLGPVVLVADGKPCSPQLRKPHAKSSSDGQTFVPAVLASVARFRSADKNRDSPVFTGPDIVHEYLLLLLACHCFFSKSSDFPMYLMLPSGSTWKTNCFVMTISGIDGLLVSA